MYLRDNQRWQLTRFHRHAECYQLTKPPARGEPQELLAVDLRTVAKPVPCKSCYPDAPRPRVARRFCPKCNKHSARACAHNGGVPVVLTYETTYRSLLREPGDECSRVIYVWPDRARLYYTTN